MITQSNCPQPHIENKTKEWTQHDKDIMAQAEKHCKVFYGKDYCIRVINKLADGSYQVLCFENKETK